MEMLKMEIFLNFLNQKWIVAMERARKTSLENGMVCYILMRRSPVTGI